MKRVLVTMVLGLLVTTAACKKKDEAGGGGGEVTAANYEARDVAMMDKAIAAFTGAGTDCDKAAAAISKFFDDNKAEMTALETFEKAHPDVKKQVEDKNKDKTAKFMDSVGKVMESCKDNKAMQDAMKKIPG